MTANRFPLRPPGQFIRWLSVRKLWKVVALALVALWLPVTMHCLLEAMPGLELLGCCIHPDSAPHQDSDCDQDVCAQVESGLYLPGSPTAKVVLPSFTPLNDPAPPAQVDPLPQLTFHDCPDGSLPGPVPAWVFVQRAALPVRAPSFVS